MGGPWLEKYPLPLATWAPQPKKPLEIPTIWQYEHLITQIQLEIQDLLKEHNYNTVGNFLSFYRGFKQSGCYSLKEYFHNYAPPITPLHHTCVGLALQLWTKLIKLNHTFPGLTDYLYLVSCEENIDTVDNYGSLGDRIDEVAGSLEKEHVLLALRIDLAGRHGILLCDPGYHIAQVITVMYDQLYPHTGWFLQSHESNAKKEYSYDFSAQNPKFVEWTEVSTNNSGVQTRNTALIFVERAYLTAVDVTERRNLVYNFRSLLSRDAKGNVNAGIYFKIKENQDEFTIFYQEGGLKKRLKYSFGMFLHPETMVDQTVQKVIKECNTQLHLPENKLKATLTSLAQLFADYEFIKQLLEINKEISNVSEPN